MGWDDFEVLCADYVASRKEEDHIRLNESLMGIIDTLNKRGVNINESYAKLKESSQGAGVCLSWFLNMYVGRGKNVVHNLMIAQSDYRHHRGIGSICNLDGEIETAA